MYKGVVCRIHTEEIPGADNIQFGNCLGYKIFISKDTKDNDLGVYFEVDGKLSEEFLSYNSLFRQFDLNKDKSKIGYFEPSGRVKSLKLSKFGVSNGFWVPISYFDFTGFDLSKKAEGWEFDTLNNYKICEKYYTPATLAHMQRLANKNKKKNIAWETIGYLKGALLNPSAQRVNFPEHYDTLHFRRTYSQIPAGATIYVSNKMHGTSQRIAFAPVEKYVYKTKFSSWFMNTFFNKPSKVNTFERKYGTRRVVLGDTVKGGYYGDNQFRFDSFDSSKLREGEALYGEIVGYLASGASIMPSQDSSKLGNKEFKKLFGDTITYSYGCKAGESAFWVYNLKKINYKGNWQDVPYNEFVARAKELNVPVCPLLDTWIHDGDADALLKRVVEFVEDTKTNIPKKDCLDNHPQEGVIIRTEHEGVITFYKLKSSAFLYLEGVGKEDPTYIDIEETQGTEEGN